jgi:hypothetical protein
MVKSRGDTIVSLLYAAAAGDLSALKRHKVCVIPIDLNIDVTPPAPHWQAWWQVVCSPLLATSLLSSAKGQIHRLN